MNRTYTTFAGRAAGREPVDANSRMGCHDEHRPYERQQVYRGLFV